MDGLQYKYNGRIWKSSPTVADTDSFFHSVFGKEMEDQENKFFDEYVECRRMSWKSLLKYYKKNSKPITLKTQLNKCFTARDKEFSLDNMKDYKMYMDDIEDSTYPVSSEEIPILASLENVKIVLFVNANDNPLVIEPNLEIIAAPLQKHTNTVDEKVICLEGNYFSRLSAVKDSIQENIKSSNESNVKTELNKEVSRKSYKKLGTTGIEGGIYQVHLLTIFLLNGLERPEEWYLSTENDKAGKLDDLVFEFGPLSMTILLQAKSKKNKKNIITSQDLFSTNTKNDDFSLPKYFFSYEEVKNLFRVDKVIICTNTNLQIKNVKHLIKEERLSVDSMLYLQEVGGNCYTFNNNIISELEEKIFEYYSKNLQRKDPPIDSSIICKENIEQFLNHLQLITDYPSKKSLDKFLDKKISQMGVAKNLNSKIVSKYIQKKMIDWLKEEKGRKLTKLETTTFFCEIRSNKYCEMLNSCNICFNNNKLTFNNDTKILHFVCELDYLLNVVKIYQTLQMSEKLNETLIVNPDDEIVIQKQVVESFEVSSYTTLVIISFNTVSELILKEICEKILRIIKDFAYKKLILIAMEADSLASLLKNSEYNYEKVYQPIVFSSLTDDSKDRLLKEKFINFQNKKISLGKLLVTDEEKEILDNEILTKLIKNKPVNIGTDYAFFNEDIKNFYICRLFNYELNGKIRSLTEDEMCKIDETNKEKIVLICDAAGTGKSSVLTNLAIKLNKIYPHLWIIRIDLNSYTKIFYKFLKEDVESINIFDLLNSEDFTKFKTVFEKKIFQLRDKVILMFDGVDEISPDYTHLVINLISESLEAENVKKIFVTARSNMQTKLEGYFKIKSFALKEFSEDEQIYFLKNYWVTSWNHQTDNKEKKSEIYALALIDKLESMGLSTDFTASPLQIMMIAEIFQDETKEIGLEWEGCRNFLCSNTEDPKFPKRLNLSMLYKIFIDKKKHIFINDKANANGNLTAMQALEEELKSLQNYHYKLAFAAIFNKRENVLYVKFLQNTNFYNLSDDTLEKSIIKLGIIQKRNNRLFFIHQTFAEYFVSENLINQLSEWDDNEEFHNFFLSELLTGFHFQIIRYFLDNLLQTATDLQKLPENILEINLKESTLSQIIHTLTREGCVELLKFVFRCYKFNISAVINTQDKSGNTPLIKAASNGYLEIVEFLLRYDARLNTVSELEPSHPFSTAMINNLDILKYLVDVSAHSNIVTNNSDTILHFTSNINTVKFLLAVGFDVDAKDARGQTVIFKAAFEGNLDTVAFLVQQGADFRIRDNDGQTVLFGAAYQNRIEVVKYLVDVGVDIKTKDKNGMSVLHLVADYGLDEVAEFLLSCGADINESDDMGMTPLHYASNRGQLHMVEFLLTGHIDETTIKIFSTSNEKLKTGNSLVFQKADINIRDKYGQTALYYAVEMNYIEIVEYLIEKEVDFTNRDEDGKTILHIAAQRSDVEIVKLLVRHCTDINETDNLDRTPLHYCAVSHNFEVYETVANSIFEDTSENADYYERSVLELIEFLIKHNADFRIRDKDGQTALYGATFTNNLFFVKYLLGKGADIKNRDKNGMTVLHFAAKSGFIKIVEFLLQSGADIYENDDFGNTALHYALEGGHSDVVNLLNSETGKS